jgi:ABC-type uncharacterized transport system auxiliary subunit
MKNLAVVFMGALVLAGCGSVRYPTSYVLNFPPPAPRAALSNGALGPVAIREFRCPEYLCEGRIVYRPGPEEVGFYENHRWAMNPRQAITQYLENGLRTQSLFQSVTVRERGSEAAYVLSGSIQRLEEVDEGRDVHAVCTISAQLLDTRTRSVVWSHTASETVSVEKRDIAGVVSSLAAAAGTAADRLLKSMTDELPATTAQIGSSTRPEETSPRTVPIHPR